MRWVVRSSLLLVASLAASGSVPACTFDHHCPATCDGVRVVPRGCTPEFRCERIEAFARDCAASTPPVAFKIGDNEHRVPQTCLLTADSAVCGPDKSSAQTQLTVDCIRVSEAFSETSGYREMLERVRVESAAICRDHIEDAVIDIGVNIAFLAALGTARQWRDVGLALVGLANDRVLGAAITGRYARQASDSLKKWAGRFTAGKPTAADYCGFQEELRDVTIPAIEKVIEQLHAESNVCRKTRDVFDAFPDPVDRPPEIDLEPREPLKPPSPPPESAPVPPPQTYVPACSCRVAGSERVPMVVGKTLDDAYGALARCNLVGQVGDSRYSEQQAEGRVLEQKQVAGECLPPGSRVMLVGSLGVNRRSGMWIEPADARMAVGETLELSANVRFVDGTWQSFSHGASWDAELLGRHFSLDINRFTPTEAGTYRITATFDSLSANATVVVSPARTSIGRGDWNVYCTFEGEVVAIQGYSTGTMEGPFKSVADADGWIAVHCPSRRCDRAFTCLADHEAADDEQGWGSTPPGVVTDQPATIGEGGWDDLQGDVVDETACDGDAVAQAFSRADAAASVGALSEWASAIAAVMASGCRNARLRDSVLAATEAVRQQEAREQKIATLVQSRRPGVDYAGLLRVLTQTLGVVEQARSAARSGNTSGMTGVSGIPTSGGMSGSSTTGTTTAGGVSNSNTACQQATARLKANSDAQRRSPAGSDEATRLQQEARSLRAAMCRACNIQGGFCQ